jgi:4-hydroxybenzoate polyprenyltransferase
MGVDGNMNKNVVGVILIVLALVIGYIYAWPKMKNYISPPAAPASEPGMTTGPLF